MENPIYSIETKAATSHPIPEQNTLEALCVSANALRAPANQQCVKHSNAMYYRHCVTVQRTFPRPVRRRRIT